MLCGGSLYDDSVDADSAYNFAIDEINQIKDKIESDKIIKLEKEQKNLGESPKSNFTKEQYFEMLEKLANISKLAIYFEVVPSQRLSVEFKAHPFLLYESLRRINPSPYMYYIKFRDFLYCRI